MSRMVSRAVALFRLTMSLTTPGCGIQAMSGTSLAWILVMMSWLMLVTLDHAMVKPRAFASGSTTALIPSRMGWSTLTQILTVAPLTLPDAFPLSPPPDEPELKQAEVSRATALTATTDLIRVDPRIDGSFVVSGRSTAHVAP